MENKTEAEVSTPLSAISAPFYQIVPSETFDRAVEKKFGSVEKFQKMTGFAKACDRRLSSKNKALDEEINKKAEVEGFRYTSPELDDGNPEHREFRRLSEAYLDMRARLSGSGDKHFLVTTHNGNVTGAFELTVLPPVSASKRVANQIKAIWNAVVGGISKFFAGLVKEVK